MAAKNFSAILRQTLNYEGGWSDEKLDPGGPTMKGITLKTYSDFLKRLPTKDELRSISKEDVESIYKNKFWNRICGDILPSGIDACVFDFAVNSGPTRAIKLLQSQIGVVVDGVIGPLTISAVDKCVKIRGINICIYEYQSGRLKFINKLSTFPKFGKGWTRRVDDLEEFAEKISTQLA